MSWMPSGSPAWSDLLLQLQRVPIAEQDRSSPTGGAVASPALRVPSPATPGANMKQKLGEVLPNPI